MVKTLLKNAFSNYANMIISMVAALVMSPVMVHGLGDFFYGVWALVISVTGYFSLLDLGMNRAIVRYVSMYEAKEDKEELNHFFNTTLVLYSLLGLLIIVLTAIVACVVDRFIDLKGYIHLGRVIVFLVGFDLAFTFPFGVMYAVLIAKQQHSVVNRINIINTLTRNAAIYTALALYPHIVCVALINIAFNATKNFAIYRRLTMSVPYLVFNRRYFDRSRVSQILNYSVHSFIISVSSRVINFTDEIVVATFIGVGEVTYYSIATSLVTYFEKMVWAGASVFVPYISHLDTKGEQELVKESFFVGSKYTLLFSLYVFCGIFLIGGDFVGVWMGKRYGEVVKPILLVLALAKVISLSQSMAIARFFGTSRHEVLGKLNTMEAVGNLVLSLLLVRWYGMIGIAIGTLIPSCICNSIILPLITFREFNVSYLEFLLKSVLGPVAVFAITVVALRAMRHGASYPELLAQGLAVTLIFALLSFLLVLDSRERDYVFTRKGWRYEV